VMAGLCGAKKGKRGRTSGLPLDAKKAGNHHTVVEGGGTQETYSLKRRQHDQKGSGTAETEEEGEKGEGGPKVTVRKKKEG